MGLKDTNTGSWKLFISYRESTKLHPQITKSLTDHKTIYLSNYNSFFNNVLSLLILNSILKRIRSIINTSWRFMSLYTSQWVQNQYEVSIKFSIWSNIFKFFILQLLCSSITIHSCQKSTADVCQQNTYRQTLTKTLL